MTTFYVRQTDGADTDDGSTWALAKATLSSASTAALAGDTIYLDKNLANSNVATTTYTFAGTIASPVKVIGVNSTGNPQPPTTAETGAAVETTGSFSMTFNGSVYMHGATLRVGAGSSSSSLTFNLNTTDGHHQKYENCTLHTATTSGTNINIGANSSSVEGVVVFANTNLLFGATNHMLRAYMKFRWDGGELASGTAAITNLFNTGSMGVDAIVTGVDLSRAATAFNVVASGMNQYGQIVLRNCKLPANWTGKLMGGEPVNSSFRAIMHNCSSGSTLYPLWEEDMMGKAVRESTVVKTGGANDGATTFSWKVTSKTTTTYPMSLFNSPELPAKWNATVGSSVTVSVDILADNAVGLTNEDVWLEVQYYASTDAKTTFISSAKASPVASAQTVASSAASWTTTGVTNPQKQRLSVSFTPQKAGFIQGKICVAKPNTTLYVDPIFIVS